MDQSTVSSIFCPPGAIAVLANSGAWDDFKLFLASLKLWNSSLPAIYLYCDSYTEKTIKSTYPEFIIHCRSCLDNYPKVNRPLLESQPSQKGLTNRWHDFMNEKIELLQWALESLPNQDKNRGVLFCDADLIWLGPLPCVPEGTRVALSPHNIRKYDEEKFGKYNGGLVWTNSLDCITTWRTASATGRFFEQSALEDVASSVASNELYEFGSHVNYGWWRLYQGTDSIQNLKQRWGIRRDPEETHSGILVDGQALLCIHTHWVTKDTITLEFNKWVLNRLELVKKQKRVSALLKLLR